MFKRSVLTLFLTAFPAFADAPVIQAAKAQRVGNLWTFEVTVLHGDTGWDHYADAWRVVDTQGNVLGLRNLAHPHVNEQPFTRTLSGASIPEDVTEVGIQTHDNTTGWSTDITKVKIR